MCHIASLFLFLSTLSATLSPESTLPLDTLLSRHFEKAANLMAEGNYDSAQSHFDKAFSLPGCKHSSFYPILLNEQATLHTYTGNFNQAIKLKKAVVPYLKQVDNPETHISVYNDLGILYRRQSQNDSALYYYDKALGVASQYTDKSWMANLCLNLSVLYYNLQRTDKAETYIDQAYAYIQAADDAEVMMSIHQVRASIQSKLGKREQAKASLNTAWEMAIKHQLPNWQMRCLPSLINFYQKEENPDSVNYFLKQGEELLQVLPAQSINVLGFLHSRLDVWFNQGRYQEVWQEMKRLHHQQNIETNASFFQRMAKCCYHLENYKAAYHYMDSARLVTDSLAQADLTQRMAELNQKYENVSKEFQISLLKQEKMAKESLWMKTGILAIILITILSIGLLILVHKRKLSLIHLEELRKKNELTNAQKYIEGLENERKRFAKELHDGLSNDLLGLQFQVDTLASHPSLPNISQQIHRIRENIRTISHELMPPEFSHLPLSEILQFYCADFQKHTGKTIKFTYDKDVNWASLPNHIAYEVYRILQENTTNIIKHSATHEIDINLRLHTAQSAELTLRFPGERLSFPEKSNGIGILTMRDRALSIEGEITTGYIQGKNEIKLRFPFNQPSFLSPK